MGWFFSKAALLTFGGAYAVLPYVYQGAVEHYHWLLPQQMIDGLALGETTPGPLIMVVTFVGFVAGWAKTLFGPDQLFLDGRYSGSCRHLFHLLAQFPVHSGGRPIGRIHTRESEVHSAVNRHHGRRGRRDLESGSVFCLSRLLATGFYGPF